MNQLFTKKTIGLTLAASLWLFGLNAQVRVSGRVTDQVSGEALIGATVKEKGVVNGTLTDYDGNYNLTVGRADAVLVFSYTGYTSIEIALGERTTVDAVLGEDPKLLNEIVVIGYGTQRKSDLTGAVGTIKAKEIERIPTSSIEQALQGKIAGVYVTPASGEPGAGATIRIRGTGTLNNASPLFVVDGMLLDDASFVNPQDVASIEVLKDASAAAIYGNRGANGVIIITTKQGVAGRPPVFSLSTYYGSQRIAKKIPLVNAAEFAQMYNELPTTEPDYYADPASLGTGTDWQDEVTRPASIGNVQLGVNGGFRKLVYSLSGNYFNQEGIVQQTGLSPRMSGRFNGLYSPTSFLKIGANLTYATHQIKSVGGSPLGSTYRMPPVFGPKDSTGNFSDPTFFGLALANPAADLFYKNDFRVRVNRWVGTVYATLTFFKNFTFKTNYGFDRYDERLHYYEPAFQVSASQLNLQARTTRDTTTRRVWLLENTLAYDKTWNILRVNVLAGQTAQEYSRHDIRTIDYILQPEGDKTFEWAMVSYLFRVNATLLDRYLFTASWRRDGSSRFSRANRWGNFPSVAVGWNLAEEPFMAHQKLFDRLKFRASYGILGNDKTQDYPSLGIIQDELYSAFSDTIQPGATLVNYANAGVRWETTRQTDVGLEIAVLNGRLSFEADWYRRHSYDILAELPIPDYVGSGSAPVINSAEVRNEGWDFTLLWRETRGKVSYNFGVVYAPLTNNVLRLNEGKSAIFAANTSQNNFATRTVVGGPIGGFYGFKQEGIFQTAEEIANSPNFGVEKPGDIRFADLNGDGKLDETDRTYLGSSIPTKTYGFNAGIEVFGFDFAADFFGVKGNKVVNAKTVSRFGVYNWERLWYDGRWTGEGTSDHVPRVTNGGHNYRMSDFLVEDGSFFRLRSIVLGYSLPKSLLSRMKISRLRFYVSGTNLWTKQAYSGYSPEFPNSSVYEAGVDYLNYPMNKTILGGLDVTF